MREKFLSFSLPYVGQEEINEVIEALRSGWLTSGPRTRQFEQEFSQYTGAPGALALNSCTAGLHVALKVLNIGPGDEVITTPITFAASVNVIEHVGATPVLADVEADTLNIDPVQIEKAITPATRAIIAVHYAGHPVELNAVRDIAARHHLHLIEDAAHAVGAEFHGEPIGSRDNFTAFSFYATKNLTTGEGGMLTGNQELLDRARIVSLHGMNREAWSRYAAGGKWAYDIVEPGFKYNMTDIQAALGLQQLRRFTWMQERRAHIVNQYNQAFQSAAFITPVTRNFVRNAHHLYVLRIREGELSIDRNQFIDEMTARNIGTSVHFIPIHMHSWYRNKYGYTPDSFPVAHRAFQQMLSLPLSPSMSDQDVSDVIDAVLDIRTKFARRRIAA